MIDQLLATTGRPTFTPSIMLPILLVLLGVITVVLALPIRRATRTVGRASVDPFRALRIAMLAKSSSIVGAGVAGVSLGFIAFLVTRPVPPSLGSMSAVIASLIGAGVLVAAGLVAEHLCTLRKDDDEQPPEPGPATTPSHH